MIKFVFLIKFKLFLYAEKESIDLNNYLKGKRNYERR